MHKTRRGSTFTIIEISIKEGLSFYHIHISFAPYILPLSSYQTLYTSRFINDSFQAKHSKQFLKIFQLMFNSTCEFYSLCRTLEHSNIPSRFLLLKNTVPFLFFFSHTQGGKFKSRSIDVQIIYLSLFKSLYTSIRSLSTKETFPSLFKKTKDKEKREKKKKEGKKGLIDAPVGLPLLILGGELDAFDRSTTSHFPGPRHEGGGRRRKKWRKKTEEEDKRSRERRKRERRKKERWSRFHDGEHNRGIETKID